MSRKQNVRSQIAQLKQSLSEREVADFSQKIFNSLLQTDEFQSARCIALYHSIQGEVTTTDILAASRLLGKVIALPVVCGEKMEFHLFTGTEQLSPGAFGIAEPYTSELVPPEKIDLFIVPGIAFDRKGNRIGRGKGYYDKYLSNIQKPIIGLCFGFQLLDAIPTESHDVKMTKIMTENGEWRMNNEQ